MKKYFAFRKKEKPETQPRFEGFGLLNPEDEGFEVSVRNDEPIIRRLGEEEEHIPQWIHDLQLNLFSAIVLVAVFGLLLTASDLTEMIFFAFPAFAVFMLLSELESFGKEKLQFILGAIMAAALIAVLIVFRKYIGNGWALIMDHLYDNAEMAQAYVYDRFHIGDTGDEHPYRCMHFAVLWGSSLLGLITALPTARFRRGIIMALAGAAMLAFAYYGLIPSIVCIAVLLVALVLVLSRGSIISSLSVLLAVVIVFGAITFIDPGESYSISRADETFRDRFALRSAFLESEENSLDDIESLEQKMKDQQDQKDANQGSEFITENSWIVTAVIVLAVVAALGAAAWFVLKKLRLRQAENRAGIDSPDPKTAITAMFPYTVKWLQPAGIEAAGKPFISLEPLIRADISEPYADRYTEMYELWKEAAYSNHEMDEERRSEMKSFLGDTVDMIKEKSDLRTRIVNTFKYAL